MRYGWVVFIMSSHLACEPGAPQESASLSGAGETVAEDHNDADMQRFSCQVANITYDGKSNFQSCPNGIDFEVTGLSIDSEEFTSNFICYKSANDPVREVLEFSENDGNWAAESVTAAPGQVLEFKLLAEEQKGEMVFEGSKLSTPCNRYEAAPSAPGQNSEVSQETIRLALKQCLRKTVLTCGNESLCEYDKKYRYCVHNDATLVESSCGFEVKWKDGTILDVTTAVQKLPGEESFEGGFSDEPASSSFALCDTSDPLQVLKDEL